MRVWRISKRDYAAFDGQGGRLASARWHHRGVPVVYTAGSLSLAALEFFIHIPSGISLTSYAVVSADIPDRVHVETLKLADLPAQWRDHRNLELSRDAGTEWLKAGKTAVLAVPSAVIPVEMNYLLNPGHPSFKDIRIHPPEPFEFDYRMWK